MDVTLVPYGNETDTAIRLIIQFWQAHNHETPSWEDAADDLTQWTKDGHYLYFIRYGSDVVGFVHLGSRGAEMDWLEDIFVLPEFQGKGNRHPRHCTGGENCEHVFGVTLYRSRRKKRKGHPLIQEVGI